MGEGLDRSNGGAHKAHVGFEHPHALADGVTVACGGVFVLSSRRIKEPGALTKDKLSSDLVCFGQA